VGDDVEAHYTYADNVTREWLPAIITFVNEDGTIDVDYDDGEQQQDIPREDIRRKRGKKDDSDDDEEVLEVDEDSGGVGGGGRSGNALEAGLVHVQGGD
jgi:hypothetical protein